MPNLKSSKQNGGSRRYTATTKINAQHLPGMIVKTSRGGLPSKVKQTTMDINDCEVEMKRIDKINDYQRQTSTKIRRASIEEHKRKELEMREDVTMCESGCIDSRERLTQSCRDAAIHRLERDTRDKRLTQISAVVLESRGYKTILLESLEYMVPYREYLEVAAKLMNFGSISSLLIHHDSLLHTKRELTSQYENSIQRLDDEKKLLVETRTFAAELELQTNNVVTEHSITREALDKNNKHWEFITDTWAKNMSASALMKWRESCAVTTVYTKLMTFFGEPEETTDQFEQLTIIEWRMMNLIGIGNDQQNSYFHTARPDNNSKSTKNTNMSHAESLDIIAQSKHTEEQLKVEYSGQELNYNNEPLALDTNENKTPTRQPESSIPITLLVKGPKRSILKESLKENIQTQPEQVDTNKEDESATFNELLRQALHGKRKVNTRRDDLPLKSVLPNIETDNQRDSNKLQNKPVSVLVEEDRGKKAASKSSVDKVSTKGTPFWRTTLRAERRDNEEMCTGSDGEITSGLLQRNSSRLKQTGSLIHKPAIGKAKSLQKDGSTTKNEDISDVSKETTENNLQIKDDDGLRMTSDEENGKFGNKTFIAIRNRTLRSLRNTPGPIPRLGRGIHDNKVTLGHKQVPSLRHRADAIVRNTSVPRIGVTSFEKLQPKRAPLANDVISRTKSDAKSLNGLRETVLKQHEVVPRLGKVVPRVYKAVSRIEEKVKRKDKSLPLLSSAVPEAHKKPSKLTRDLPTLRETASKQREFVSEPRATKKVENGKALDRNKNMCIKRTPTSNKCVARVYISDIKRRKNMTLSKKPSLETIWETNETAQT